MVFNPVFFWISFSLFLAGMVFCIVSSIKNNSLFFLFSILCSIAAVISLFFVFSKPECPKCGFATYDRFCEKCGQELAIHCPECDRYVDDRAFCPDCGTDLKGATQ